SKAKLRCRATRIMAGARERLAWSVPFMDAATRHAPELGSAVVTLKGHPKGKGRHADEAGRYRPRPALSRYRRSRKGAPLTLRSPERPAGRHRTEGRRASGNVQT